MIELKKELVGVCDTKCAAAMGVSGRSLVRTWRLTFDWPGEDSGELFPFTGADCQGSQIALGRWDPGSG